MCCRSCSASAGPTAGRAPASAKTCAEGAFCVSRTAIDPRQTIGRRRMPLSTPSARPSATDPARCTRSLQAPVDETDDRQTFAFLDITSQARRCMDTSRGSDLCCMAIAKAGRRYAGHWGTTPLRQERSGTVRCPAMCRVLAMREGH